jgi:hypothetical protein
MERAWRGGKAGGESGRNRENGPLARRGLARRAAARFVTGVFAAARFRRTFLPP